MGHGIAGPWLALADPDALEAAFAEVDYAGMSPEHAAYMTSISLMLDELRSGAIQGVAFRSVAPTKGAVGRASLIVTAGIGDMGAVARPGARQVRVGAVDTPYGEGSVLRWVETVAGAELSRVEYRMPTGSAGEDLRMTFSAERRLEWALPQNGADLAACLADLSGNSDDGTA